MKALKNGLGLGAVAIAILALPAAATGEAVVPPENSAATQYTESIPTGGGQKDAGKAGGKVTPAAVLGAHKAKKLESHGREGREVAEVVAATAPAPLPTPPPSAAPAPEPASGDGGKAKAEPSSGGANQAGLSDNEAVSTPPSEPALNLVDVPAGSSGLGEVLAQATGSSSSGSLGALLPLLLLAALGWALAFAWRQRQRAA